MGFGSGGSGETPKGDEASGAAASDRARIRRRRQVRSLLSGADRVLVLTGAGISADSGVPVFRGEDGLWKEHRPEELATPAAFARDPRLVWEWYAWRRDVVAACAPNEAHLALARYALGGARVDLVTQNVDGLHTRAAEEVAAGGADGTLEDALPLELHGCLFRVRCTGCGEVTEDRSDVDASSVESLPSCRDCGELLRPDVVWFGESLPAGILERARAAALAADVGIVVGTSGVVQPAAGIAVSCRQAGGVLVEVNPEPTALSDLADVVVRKRAAEGLPPLLEG